MATLTGFIPTTQIQGHRKVYVGLTATGSTAADATILGGIDVIAEFASVPSGSGVVLPRVDSTTSTPWQPALVSVRNNDAANALTVYAPGSGTINGAASASIAAGSSATFVLCSNDGLTWRSV